MILVGEMRDRETIEIALTAAETGHLVFSTLHTIDASKTVERIVGTFEVSDQQAVRGRLAASFRYFISQRLIPKKGGGRMAIIEMLKATMRTREYIEMGEKEGKSLLDAMRDGALDGMQYFDGELEKLVRAGTISQSTALLYATNPGNLRVALADVPDEDSLITQVAGQQARQASRSSAIERAPTASSISFGVAGFCRNDWPIVQRQLAAGEVRAVAAREDHAQARAGIFSSLSASSRPLMPSGITTSVSTRSMWPSDSLTGAQAVRAVRGLDHADSRRARAPCASASARRARPRRAGSFRSRRAAPALRLTATAACGLRATIAGSTTSNVVPRPTRLDTVDAAAVLRHDPERGRQPEPGALAGVLGRVERIEDPRQALRRNAGAGVDDADDRLIAGRRRSRRRLDAQPARRTASHHAR